MSDNKPEGAAPDPRDQPGADSGNAPASNEVEQAGVVEGRPVEVKHGMWGSGSGDTSGYGGIVRTVAIGVR